MLRMIRDIGSAYPGGLRASPVFSALHRSFFRAQPAYKKDELIDYYMNS
jgi:hypothetical protein